VRVEGDMSERCGALILRQSERGLSGPARSAESGDMSEGCGVPTLRQSERGLSGPARSAESGES